MKTKKLLSMELSALLIGNVCLPQFDTKLKAEPMTALADTYTQLGIVD